MLQDCLKGKIRCSLLKRMGNNILPTGVSKVGQIIVGFLAFNVRLMFFSKRLKNCFA